MKKSKKSLILILAAAAILSMLLTIPVLAASTRKCYLIKNQNTTVYSNTALTKKYGTVYGSDEIKVLSVTSKYTRITYPISKGRTKTGYIKTSAILKGTSGPSYTARAKITTYKRPGGSTYGSVYKGDKVMILGTSGSYTQIKYPVSGGYKYAFVKTTNANKYIKPSSTSTSKPKQEKNTSSGLAYPVPSGCKFSKKTSDGGWYGYHDINRNVTSSTPVYAIANGKVTYKQAYRTYGGVKYLTSYGNYIEFVSSDKKYSAKYCHLSKFANGVSQKIKSSRTKRVSGSAGTYTLTTRTVKKGDIIGYIGTTGNSSGNHLHFELRKSAKRIDPTSVFPKLK